MAMLASTRTAPHKALANAIASSSRHVSSSASASAAAPAAAPPRGGSVQDADRELAALKLREANMRRLSKGLDVTSLNIPLLEGDVAQKFQWSWLFKRGGWKHFFARVKGGYQDRQFLNAIIGANGITKRKGKEPLTSTYQAIRCFQPSYKAGLMLKEAEEVYKAFNAAQASGDEAALRKFSAGPVLASALKLAKNNRHNLSWELKRMNEQPKVMVARMSQIDPAATMHVAQVTVRFDSDQVLTTSSRSGPTRKEQRVVEHYVLEKTLPSGGNWKIKDRPTLTLPDCAK